MFESCGHIEVLDGCIVVGFGLGGRDVPDGSEQAVIVEPVYPAQGRHFHRRSVWPCALAPDNLGLVEAVDRLGQGVVVACRDPAPVLKFVEQPLDQVAPFVFGAVVRSGVATVDLGRDHRLYACGLDLRRVEYGDERDPKQRAKLLEISPLTKIDQLSIPLLVVKPPRTIARPRSAERERHSASAREANRREAGRQAAPQGRPS